MAPHALVGGPKKQSKKWKGALSNPLPMVMRSSEQFYRQKTVFEDFPIEIPIIKSVYPGEGLPDMQSPKQKLF